MTGAWLLANDLKQISDCTGGRKRCSSILPVRTKYTIFMNILLTGGAGYIGSHTIIELDKAGHSVVVVDNLVNSNPESLLRVSKIIGKEIPFYEVDVRDKDNLSKVFDENKIDAVVHFAGLKAVGESVSKPLEYYHNNMTGTFFLLDVMRQHGCKNIIFSSSATVYGDPRNTGTGTRVKNG